MGLLAKVGHDKLLTSVACSTLSWAPAAVSPDIDPSLGARFQAQRAIARLRLPLPRR